MQGPVNLPGMPGTYILIMRLEAPVTITVGRLGVFALDKGMYAYFGSARGAGGLRARVGRHLRQSGKKLHWHVDALTAVASIVEVWFVESAERLECEWAQAVAGVPGVRQPIAGFGASDCGCRAHLLALVDDTEMLEVVWQVLGRPVRISTTHGE